MYSLVITLTFTVAKASAETTPSLYYQRVIDFKPAFTSRMSATGTSCSQILLKVWYNISQAILGRKLMKKFTITDEKIFRVYEDFDHKK